MVEGTEDLEKIGSEQYEPKYKKVMKAELEEMKTSAPARKSISDYIHEARPHMEAAKQNLSQGYSNFQKFREEQEARRIAKEKLDLERQQMYLKRGKQEVQKLKLIRSMHKEGIGYA